MTVLYCSDIFARGQNLMEKKSSKPKRTLISETCQSNHQQFLFLFFKPNNQQFYKYKNFIFKKSGYIYIYYKVKMETKLLLQAPDCGRKINSTKSKNL